MKNISATEKETLRIELHNKQGRLKMLNHDIDERSTKIINLSPSSPIYQAIETKVNSQQIEVDELEERVTKIKQILDNTNEDIMTIENFLNYSIEASTRLKAGNPIVKD